ncbi:hypothetical protein BH09BAC4_BH09BAC4_43190 [soil metagenome]
MPEKSKPQPFINAHTHIFTHKNVPPYIAKTLVPFPVYFLLNIPLLIRLVHYFTHKQGDKLPFQIRDGFTQLRFLINRYTQHKLITRLLVLVLDMAIRLLNILFVISFPIYYGGWQKKWGFFDSAINQILGVSILGRILFVVFSALLFAPVRRMFWWVLQNVFGFLKSLTGPQTIALVKRYIAMAYYADKFNQGDVFRNLTNLYPDSTRFVVLPMDMDYMAAGKPQEDYPHQLADLRGMLKSQNSFFKKYALPFVAVDPRRIADPANQFTHQFITQLIDQDGFCGIKLYPPMGYFPFDKHLLETLLWACKNGVPVTTHCLRGIIYYRGLKQRDWDFHPIFKDTKGKPIALRSYKNREFSYNFTHPLNYECLLDPALLADVLRYHNDSALNQLYDFDASNPNAVPANTLTKLKLCLAHFGGEDEWERFLDRDKGDFEIALHDPLKTYTLDKGKMEPYWESVSWFSIVYNMLLKYPNVYADLSFILYDERIMNLLKQIMQTREIADKILFGTDFFVVRQKKTEKVLWTDLRAELGEAAFYQIAQTNPARFLNLTPATP